MSKEKLNDDFPVDSAKVSSKNNPTLLLRADDSLHKLPANVLESHQAFSKNLDRLDNIKKVNSLRDLVESLKENNKKLDDLTIVYFEEGEESTEAS